MTNSSKAKEHYLSCPKYPEQREMRVQPTWVPSEGEEGWILKNVRQPWLIYRGHAFIRRRFVLLTSQVVAQLLRWHSNRHRAPVLSTRRWQEGQGDVPTAHHGFLRATAQQATR
ncbi:hypothetical protein SAMN00790413_06599 [Deinococcus hopiensis KR-140]|uniref:Uncharacterized protein n=2 Tax=Deinococcus TaxID=1298 RepID=A0A1W1UBA1_9DEIO|nr:hypothetical protein SAMN00790413_06599 [Deinococcus hopiensis KR-140]